MKIKYFIVTYNNEKRINKCLESLFAPGYGLDKGSLEVVVLNNHSKINIREEFKSRVTVLNNQTRPDFSTGHLSRSWNQALINGFRDLSKPDCDVVVTIQDDTIFEKNHLEMTMELAEFFDFVSYGTGDQFIMYTPKGVKRIGLWDERFCNIGFQEADYFIRAFKYHDKVSINDERHGRSHNPQGSMMPIVKTPSGHDIGDESHLRSAVYHPQSSAVFWAKWGFRPQTWDEDHLEIAKKTDPMINSFVLYPYFENYVETLKEQKYILP